jgi:type IV fimbrial biogenesis protein FimT
MQNKHKGFTLIELMVTIAVMAIIAMMAAPSFMQQIRRMQLNNDAQEVVQLAIETRSEAIFRKQNRQIILTSSTGSGFKNWQPSANTTWVTTAIPDAMTYNFFWLFNRRQGVCDLRACKRCDFKGSDSFQ